MAGLNQADHRYPDVGVLKGDSETDQVKAIRSSVQVGNRASDCRMTTKSERYEPTGVDRIEAALLGQEAKLVRRGAVIREDGFLRSSEADEVHALRDLVVPSGVIDGNVE